MESNGVPTAIEALVTAWRSEGRPAQAVMSWPRQRWIEGSPEHADTLRTLPHALDRVAVRRACSDAAADTASAVAAFIAVMAWGFGNVGYGPHRTREILSATPDAPARLARIARTLSESSAVTAYRRLARDDDSRLKGLGPAFSDRCRARPRLVGDGEPHDHIFVSEATDPAAPMPTLGSCPRVRLPWRARPRPRPERRQHY